MMRRTAVALFTLALAATAAPAAGVLPTSTASHVAASVRVPFGAAAAQLIPSSAEYASEYVELGTGAIWSAEGFDMTVHDFLTAPSPSLTAITEVRVAVSIRNTGDEALPFAEDAFFSDREYAKLRLLDGAGVPTGIDILRPNRGTAPLARLHVIEPGMTARWVVGFRVPTANGTSLDLEAIQGGFVRASWSLSPTSSAVTWMGPELTSVSIGDAIEWSEHLTVTAGDVGAFVCGDPGIEVVSQLVAVTFAVDNSANAYTEWPGTRLPDEPAVAGWSDGSAAAAVLETFVGESDGLWRHSAEWGYIPPLTELERAFVFAVPRDARLGDFDTLPAGVALMPPGGEALWLDLTGVDATIGLDPVLCDLGAFGGPIPFAFQPNGKYEVAGEGPFADDEASDRAAKGLLASVIAAAAQFADVSDFELEDFDFDGFKEYVPSIDVLELDILSLPTTSKGSVYWAFGQSIDSESGTVIDETLLAVTQSDSGQWVCSSTDLRSGVTTVSGDTVEATLTACAPTLFAVEETEETT